MGPAVNVGFYFISLTSAIFRALKESPVEILWQIRDVHVFIWPIMSV